MNYPKAILLSLALLAMHSLNAEVVTYPAGVGVKTLNDFSVEVRQGIGFHSAKKLCENGMKVALVDLNEEKVKRAAAEVAASLQWW